MRRQDDVADEVRAILFPEWDEEGMPPATAPHPRLAKEHGIDVSFFDRRVHETWAAPYNFIAKDPMDVIFQTIESVGVPGSLMHAALVVFGDSIVAYSEPHEPQWGPLRYYPAVLMTFLAGFEAWVRITSELLVATVPTLPPVIADALLERRSVIQRSGEIDIQADRRNTLERFYLLAMYGFGAKPERGGAAWQGLDRAVTARNALVHYDTEEAPALTTKQLGAHLEAILIALIQTSAAGKRTVFKDQFELYATLMSLLAISPDFEEKPVHKGWPREPTIVYCPFDGVDTRRFQACGVLGSR